MASVDDFVALVRADGPAPQSYQVLGERSSGTHFLHVSVKRNLEIRPSELLGWKHGFPHMLAVPAPMLVLVVFRNPLDWARSMHAKPWHASAELQGLGFSDFIRAPWDSRVDRNDYFGLKPADPRIGAPLQHDRHPISGEVFDNIFQMRNAKVAAWLGLANRGCHFAAVRLEALQVDPDGALDVLASTFDLERKGGYRPVHRRLGSRFSPARPDRPETPREITPEDRKFIMSQLDAAQESRLGYRF